MVQIDVLKHFKRVFEPKLIACDDKPYSDTHDE